MSAVPAASSIPATLPASARPQPAALAVIWGGAWALADQAVLSLGNFLTSLALIRHLAPGAYGTYALIFSTLLFLVSLHAALVVYPLSLKAGAARAERDVRAFAGAALAFTGLLWPVLTVGQVGALLYLGRGDLIPLACGALLLWLIQETLRRTLLARLRHRAALVGDAVSYLGQAACVWALAWRGNLSLATALAAVAATSAAGALVQAVQVGVLAAETPRVKPARLPRALVSSLILQPSSLLSEFWPLGRWVLLVNLMAFVTVLATPWTLEAFHGAGEVARFQSLAVLLAVSHPVMMGMNGLIVPAAARALTHEGGAAGARRAGLRYALVGAALLLPYYLLLALFPVKVLAFFFGEGSSYAALATPLRLFVAAYALSYVAQTSAALLNGLGHSRTAFVAHAAAAAVTVLVSLPLAARFGLAGALWGGLVPIATHVAAALFMLKRVSGATVDDSSVVRTG